MECTIGFLWVILLSILLKYSPKGFPLEGEGIKPHHLVPMKIDDLLSGKDTQLSYAKELTRK